MLHPSVGTRTNISNKEIYIRIKYTPVDHVLAQCRTRVVQVWNVNISENRASKEKCVVAFFEVLFYKQIKYSTHICMKIQQSVNKEYENKVSKQETKIIIFLNKLFGRQGLPSIILKFKFMY